MIAPIILKARIILKNVWSTGISWDVELDKSYIAKWNKWLSALSNMESLRIPRCLKTRSLLLKRSSCGCKCVRVIARIRRLLPRRKELKSKSSIGVDELSEAESILIEFIQRDAFAHEMQLIQSGKTLKPTSSLIRLSPYLDDNRIMRVGGRLGNSDLPVSMKNPIVLPKKHPGTRLVIRHYHRLLSHASPSRTLSDLVQKYWIVHSQRAVNSVISECAFCKLRSTVKPASPFMAPLPSTRVTPNEPPFAITGVDYFGPF